MVLRFLEVKCRLTRRACSCTPLPTSKGLSLPPSRSFSPQFSPSAARTDLLAQATSRPEQISHSLAAADVFRCFCCVQIRHTSAASGAHAPEHARVAGCKHCVTVETCVFRLPAQRSGRITLCFWVRPKAFCGFPY